MKKQRPDICPFMGVCSEYCKFFVPNPREGMMGSHGTSDKCVFQGLSEVLPLMKRISETLVDIKNLLKGE